MNVGNISLHLILSWLVDTTTPSDIFRGFFNHVLDSCKHLTNWLFPKQIVFATRAGKGCFHLGSMVTTDWTARSQIYRKIVWGSTSLSYTQTTLVFCSFANCNQYFHSTMLTCVHKLNELLIKLNILTHNLVSDNVYISSAPCYLCESWIPSEQNCLQN